MVKILFRVVSRLPAVVCEGWVFRGQPPFVGINSQKATHLCRGSGAASEGKPGFLCGYLSLRSLGYLLFKIFRR